MGYMEERRMRKLDLLPKLPTRKEKKPLNKVSDKKKQELAENTKEGKENALDKWFEFHMEHSKPICAECGMEAFWLLKPQEDKEKEKAYKLIWRASQAHVLPKKKNFGFSSIATNLDNHIVLFPSWGGLLCGCHGFYDSNWYNASTMNIWKDAIEIIKTRLYPFIDPKELKNLPDIIVKELNQTT